MKIMFWLGAKPNGTPQTFTVGPEFIRNASWAISALLSLAIAGSAFVMKTRSIEPRLCDVEQAVQANKRETAELRQVSQTNQAVIIAELGGLKESVKDMQRVLMTRGR